MDPSNPYAPPSPEADHDAPAMAETDQLWREGNSVVIPVLGAVLPRRCVVCNQPGLTRLERKLYWHSPWLYLLACLGLLIYAVTALFVRKRATFQVHLCDKHVARRRHGALLGWIGVPLTMVSLGAWTEARWLVIPNVVVLLGVTFTSLYLVNVVSARRIDEHRAWLKVGRPFLESIPVRDAASPAGDGS